MWLNELEHRGDLKRVDGGEGRKGGRTRRRKVGRKDGWTGEREGGRALFMIQGGQSYEFQRLHMTTSSLCLPLCKFIEVILASSQGTGC